MSSTETPPASPQGSAESHELPIGQILSIFWRGRWIILVCTLMGAGLGFLYVQKRGPIWRAQSKVLVESNNAGPTDFLLGLGSKNYANTQTAVILSTKVLRSAFEAYDEAFPQGDAHLIPREAERYAWIRTYVETAVGKDDDLITVSLDSNHLEEACAMVNAIVDAYKDFQETRKGESAEEMHRRAREQLQAADSAFKAANKALAEFERKHPTLGSAVPGDTLRDLTRDLGEAEVMLRDAEREWEAVRLVQDEPAVLRQMSAAITSQGSQLAYSPEFAELTKDLAALQRERDLLLLELTEEHPRVGLLDANIARVQEDIEHKNQVFASYFVQLSKSRYDHASATVAALRRRTAEALAEVEAIGALRADLRGLEDDRESAQRGIVRAEAELAEHLKSVTGSEEDAFTSVNILYGADPQSTKEVSGKAMRLAAAILLGLFLGAGLAWLRGLMDQKLRTAEEVRRAVDLAVLAIMPRVKLEKPFRPALEAWKDHSPSAEAARSLRTAVYFGMDKKEGGNVLQVTSPDPGDGKTTTATQLAIAMAKAGQKVLLIDADLRKPQQHARLGITNDYGLCNVLRGEMQWKDAFHQTDDETLHLMTSGQVPPNPAELLNDPQFGKVLKQVSRRYDWVIVDSPPILPVADARIIASHVDLTLLTLRVDKSTKKRAKHAYDAIVDVGGEFLGAVLNDMPHGIGYGYGPGYGYYGRRYGYGGYGDAPSTGQAQEVSEEPSPKRRAARSTRGASAAWDNQASAAAVAVDLEQPDPETRASELRKEPIVATRRTPEEIAPKPRARKRSPKAEAALAKIRANRNGGSES